MLDIDQGKGKRRTAQSQLIATIAARRPAFGDHASVAASMGCIATRRIRIPVKWWTAERNESMRNAIVKRSGLH
jgi:hypothetical protein